MHPEHQIKITILGSGTGVPSLRRSSCSVLMQIRDTKLLFDCGPGTMRRLLEADTTIFEISVIFLSHFHPDHSSELVPFLFGNKYFGVQQRQIPLSLVAGKGFFEFHKGLKQVFDQWIELAPGLLNVTELDNNGYDGCTFHDFTIKSCPVAHNDESLAYRITSPDGISVVYSGDTDVTENLVDLAADADLLICESALPDHLKVKGHLTPSLAGNIAARAKVKKLVLTHFYPECDETDIESECRKTYAGHLTLAQDLMKIDV